MTFCFLPFECGTLSETHLSVTPCSLSTLYPMQYRYCVTFWSLDGASKSRDLCFVHALPNTQVYYLLNLSTYLSLCLYPSFRPFHFLRISSERYSSCFTELPVSDLVTFISITTRPVSKIVSLPNFSSVSLSLFILGLKKCTETHWPQEKNPDSLRFL